MSDYSKDPTNVNLLYQTKKPVDIDFRGLVIHYYDGGVKCASKVDLPNLVHNSHSRQNFMHKVSKWWDANKISERLDSIKKANEK
ncbi:MAG: hypothetical protein FWB92_02845 [Oscillospiraceae bacterium]|nr:hypothetical protein [Oscillospiraceae bacterium]